ncbi:hypothetical protein FACS189429_8730 [Bacteroidia bacterium]|nr:hypothetical protein FACS189429_8730 [Bacteroidia bacterium]
MVFYSPTARKDLAEIRKGLLGWEKIVLSVESVFEYMRDIKRVCDSIDNKQLHFNTKYETHQQHGEKAHTYKRNANTVWYIIYNIDSENNIFINKIISNYLTKS